MTPWRSFQVYFLQCWAPRLVQAAKVFVEGVETSGKPWPDHAHMCIIQSTVCSANTKFWTKCFPIRDTQWDIDQFQTFELQIVLKSNYSSPYLHLWKIVFPPHMTHPMHRTGTILWGCKQGVCFPVGPFQAWSVWVSHPSVPSESISCLSQLLCLWLVDPSLRQLETLRTLHHGVSERSCCHLADVRSRSLWRFCVCGEGSRRWDSSSEMVCGLHGPGMQTDRKKREREGLFCSIPLSKHTLVEYFPTVLMQLVFSNPH